MMHRVSERRSPKNVIRPDRSGSTPFSVILWPRHVRAVYRAICSSAAESPGKPLARGYPRCLWCCYRWRRPRLQWRRAAVARVPERRPLASVGRRRLFCDNYGANAGGGLYPRAIATVSASATKSSMASALSLRISVILAVMAPRIRSNSPRLISRGTSEFSLSAARMTASMSTWGDGALSFAILSHISVTNSSTGTWRYVAKNRRTAISQAAATTAGSSSFQPFWP
jgi:hypothetical protein